MKKFLSVLAFVALGVVGVSAQQAQVQKTKIGGPVMTFEKVDIDYGKILQGADPLRKFKFKNTGTEPLVINNARGSCGCTVPTYPKEPIAPGAVGEIEVRYDTQRVGAFTKTVSIETNEGPEARILTIHGEVKEKPNEQSVPAAAPSLLGTQKQ